MNTRRHAWDCLFSWIKQAISFTIIHNSGRAKRNQLLYFIKQLWTLKVRGGIRGPAVLWRTVYQLSSYSVSTRVISVVSRDIHRPVSNAIYQFHLYFLTVLRPCTQVEDNDAIDYAAVTSFFLRVSKIIIVTIYRFWAQMDAVFTKVSFFLTKCVSCYHVLLFFFLL